MSTDIEAPRSSPHLPGPPSIPEVQISSQSPTAAEAPSSSKPAIVASVASSDHGATRRVRRGTKAADMAASLPLIPLSQLDSPFQLQEHLKALYQSFTHPKDSDTVCPISRETALQLAQPPEGAERLLWLYELCRFLTMKANGLVVAFFSDNPPCSAATCPEMRASEWQYLCAVHEPPKSCCAIDYCCHTLDWATNVLTSQKYFPSRLTMGSDSHGGSQQCMRHLTNIFRRVYRIFAHAWFQHRQLFWEVENNEGLYVFFKTVCDVYSLIPEDNYTIPPEASGARPPPEDTGVGRRLTILRKGAKRDDSRSPDRADLKPLEIAGTTRRHRQSPSRGTSVGTIVEATEENETTKEGPSLPEGKKNGQQHPVARPQRRFVTRLRLPGSIMKQHNNAQKPQNEQAEHTASPAGSAAAPEANPSKTPPAPAIHVTENELPAPPPSNVLPDLPIRQKQPSTTVSSEEEVSPEPTHESESNQQTLEKEREERPPSSVQNEAEPPQEPEKDMTLPQFLPEVLPN